MGWDLRRDEDERRGEIERLLALPDGKRGWMGKVDVYVPRQIAVDGTKLAHYILEKKERVSRNYSSQRGITHLEHYTKEECRCPCNDFHTYSSTPPKQLQCIASPSPSSSNSRVT